MNRIIRRAVTVIALIAFLPGIASATPLFFDDFEGDLSQWVINGSGVIVVDQHDPDNNVLSFTQTAYGGDIFSQIINNPSGHYVLSFDYLGTCGTGDCGGFIKTDYLPWQGTSPSYPDTLPDTGEWVHLVFHYYGGASDRLIIEDWRGSGRVAGDAYFDNIKLVSVPEPTTLTLLGLGLLGLGLRRRKTSH